MIGERGVGQDRLFYSFSLESHVPNDHFLRAIDKFADLGFVREHLKDYYSHTGRPSIDPELMVRMLLVGYCFGICSERRLCKELHLNLAYRWFCRLGLDAPVPDHSTFSKFSHLVWITKYRYKILRGGVRLRVRDIIRQLCAENGVNIIKGVLATDHVHMFVSIPPKLALSELMRKDPDRFITRLDCSPDLWRGRCLFMQPDLHRNLHFEYPSEQTMPEKAQIG